MSIDDKVLLLLGEIRGDQRHVRSEMHLVRRQLELNRAALERQGKRIAALPCTEHERRLARISGEVGKVEETTDRIMLTEVELAARRHLIQSVARVAWKVGRVAIPILAAGGGVAAALMAALQ